MASIFDELKKLGKKKISSLGQPSPFSATPSIGAAKTGFDVLNVLTKKKQPTQQQPGLQSVPNQSVPAPTLTPKPVTAVAPQQVLPSAQPTTAPAPQIAAVPLEPPRPITPAPSMLTEAEAPALTDDDLQKSILRKSLKKQFGDSLTDAEVDFIAKQQIEKSKFDTSEFEKAQQEQLAELTRLREGEQTRTREEEERLRVQREKDIATFEKAQQVKATRDIAEARKLGAQAQSVEERFLGARGSLTSTVGTQRVGQIQATTSRAVDTINARTDAENALERARLEGADAATIETMSANVSQLRASEQEAMLQAATDLQQAKLDAQAQGAESQATLLQNALDGLNANAVATQVDKATTELINDGFLYNSTGNKIKDAEGNTVTFDSAEELSLLDQLDVQKSMLNIQKLQQDIAKTEKEAVGGQTTEEKAQAISQAKQQIDDIDTILNDPKLNAVVGAKGISTIIPGSQAQAVKNRIDSLIANLAIDERGRMKGSGAISDFEAKLISQAATSLDRNLGNEDFKAVLGELRDRFANVQRASYLEDTFGLGVQEANLQLENLKDENNGEYLTLDELQQVFPPDFNQPVSSGLNSSVGNIQDGAKVQTALGKGTATGIQAGSRLWKPGFDFVLDGGKGAQVKVPLGGTVTKVRNFGDFGKQVAIGLPDGSEVWLSHLDGVNVQPGQKIQPGSVIGTQGNSGRVIGGSGQALTQAQIASGRGTHLDITIKKPGTPDTLDPNNFFTSQQVAQLFNTRLV